VGIFVLIAPIAHAGGRTRNFLTAGDGSAAPDGSTASTRNTWLPRDSFGGRKGEVQGTKLLESSLQRKLTPGSLAVNVNLGRRLRVFFGAVPKVVSGGGFAVGVVVVVAPPEAVWTVKERVAIAELPAPSVARTLNA
jgi:hypothetical protein